MLIEFRYRFEAAHRFLESSSKRCMTPHGHSWHATLALEFVGKNLDKNGMTVEFSKVKADWKKIVDNLLDHSYLHNSDDAVAETLKNDPTCEPRLLPFPGDPTTEVIALLLFNKMETMVNLSPSKNRVRVHHLEIEETPTNKIVCPRSFYETEIIHFSKFRGWWTSSEIEDRSLVTE